MKNLIMLLVKNYSIRSFLMMGWVVFILSSCNHSEVKLPEEQTFVLSDTMMKRIEIHNAIVEPIRLQLKLAGKIIADENKLVEIFPLVGGNVAEVNVELGDYVPKGKVMAVIKSGEVADFERELIDAQSDLLVSQKNLQVAKDLFDSKLAAEKDVLAAKNEVNKNEAELARLREIFSIYGIDKKAEYQVKSPIGGFVIEKKVNRDMQLRSDKADNIFTVADIYDVWVNANVYETDISKIQNQMEAEIRTLSYPDTVFLGHVDKIYNILDPATKTMKVRIKLHNADFKLKPEMNAQVTLKYKEGGEMVAVPSSAVIFDKSKYYVMVFKDKYNIETREVEVYKQVDNITYIKKGLQNGELIISKNQLLIYDALND
jgi:cobalt-zinc-cadmium efflux system membrane fusion protein